MEKTTPVAGTPPSLPKDGLQRALGIFLIAISTIGVYLALADPAVSVRHVYKVANVLDRIFPMDPIYQSPLEMAMIAAAFLCATGIRLFWARFNATLTGLLEEAGYEFLDFTPDLTTRILAAARTAFFWAACLMVLYAGIYFAADHLSPELIRTGRPAPFDIGYGPLSLLLIIWTVVFYVGSGCLTDTFLAVADLDNRILYVSSGQKVWLDRITGWTWINEDGQEVSREVVGQQNQTPSSLSSFYLWTRWLRLVAVVIAAGRGSTTYRTEVYFADREGREGFLAWLSDHQSQETIR